MYPAQPLPHPQPCLILIESDGELGWLGQFPDLPAAEAAMAEWLAAGERDDEDRAFILPVLGCGHPTGRAAP